MIDAAKTMVSGVKEMKDERRRGGGEDGQPDSLAIGRSRPRDMIDSRLPETESE